MDESKTKISIEIDRRDIELIKEDAALTGNPSVLSLEGKTVTGTISLYHGKPEIKIMSADQLVSE